MRNIMFAAAAVGLLASPASAALLNGGFEQGMGNVPDHWIVTPVAGRAQSITQANAPNPITVTPCHGNWFGYASFGPAATGDPGTLTQTAFLSAGQTVRGCVGFLADDYDPFDDQGYFSVFDGNAKTDIFGSGIVSVLDPGTWGDPTPVGSYGWTGWRYWEYTATISGAHTFELGAYNIGDNSLPSYAVLDTFVPEPATWMMMIAGFGLVGAAARRRQRTASVA